MAGAAVLAARAAFRGGAGLVTVSIDEGLFPVIHAGVAEATCKGRDLREISPADYDAVAAGPGLGRAGHTRALVEYLLENCAGPMILDADAMYVMGRDPASLKTAKGRLIITPHPGEAARLLGVSTGEISGDRPGSALRLCEMTGAVVVLKGAATLVVSPRGGIAVNHTGNPGMASGGCGDVLTGLIAAFAGRGLDPFAAAKAGVYVHGRAGDLGAGIRGEYGLIASDLAEMTAMAIKELTENGG
jgi:NAD(P)H-hydrate epimerase